MRLVWCYCVAVEVFSAWDARDLFLYCGSICIRLALGLSNDNLSSNTCTHKAPDAEERLPRWYTFKRSWHRFSILNHSVTKQKEQYTEYWVHIYYIHLPSKNPRVKCMS
jgi:hypothetical protein